MFIETEVTPNPSTLKFLPGRLVIEEGTIDFASKSDVGGRSQLADYLFGISGVVRVFFGYDFISVSKSDSVAWEELKPIILGILMEHFMSGLPVMSGVEQASDSDSAVEYAEGDAEIVQQICELLDTRVRPAVAQDGGDIVFHGYDQGIVYLSMRGACAGCPSSTATLKMGIENLLRHYVPEVTEVRPYMQ